MPQYRHRPTIVEAWQWFPFPLSNPPQWYVDALGMGVIEQVHIDGGVLLKVHAGRGDVAAMPGDWIISEEGDLSVCGQAAFPKSFDPVE